MSFARTYFLNTLSDDQLAALLGRREDFFLENVVDMTGTVQRAQAVIAQAGLTSRYLQEPANPFLNLHHDIIGAIPLIGPLWVLGLGALRLGRPGADVTLKQTARVTLTPN
ncbi:hypothetical protein [Achromobacter marplatensis]|uniref:Uncharacterized protein n=1 Tax=Achromobacter marplatensis TaxID=470868 RepID=A0AA42WGF5_9BURK|nr:hypothetical protein [Achromobacter marplatensis]MDH2053472.1 hypothetical protein [Achromobacter marplatensis]